MFKKILPYSVITLILIIIVSVIIGVFMRKIRDNKEIPLERKENTVSFKTQVDAEYVLI